MATQWERENYHNTFISVDTRTIGNGVWIYFLATCVWHKIKYWCWFAIWSPISLASYAHICIRKTIYPITFFSLSLFSFHSLIATGGPWVRKNTLFRFDFIQLYVFFKCIWNRSSRFDDGFYCRNVGAFLLQRRCLNNITASSHYLRIICKCPKIECFTQIHCRSSLPLTDRLD